MAKEMDRIWAARLLERWINFYGMDDADAWPREDYGFVKESCEAMRLAVGLLRGDEARPGVNIKKAASVLERWPKVHSMDNPEFWESEDFPFVKNALEAVQFAASFLKQYRVTTKRIEP